MGKKEYRKPSVEKLEFDFAKVVATSLGGDEEDTHPWTEGWDICNVYVSQGDYFSASCPGD